MHLAAGKLHLAVKTVPLADRCGTDRQYPCYTLHIRTGKEKGNESEF
ncbi:MAG: hypothetical protein J6M07_01960 [Ruminococcus sp.]|nr:hypothetical protein [Ruminococcus sp.]